MPIFMDFYTIPSVYSSYILSNIVAYEFHFTIESSQWSSISIIGDDVSDVLPSHWEPVHRKENIGEDGGKFRTKTCLIKCCTRPFAVISLGKYWAIEKHGRNALRRTGDMDNATSIGWKVVVPQKGWGTILWCEYGRHQQFVQKIPGFQWFPNVSGFWKLGNLNHSKLYIVDVILIENKSYQSPLFFSGLRE